MHRLLVALLLLHLHAAMAADDVTPLTRQELLDLLPGTSAEYLTRAGSLHRWKNEADGSYYLNAVDPARKIEFRR